MVDEQNLAVEALSTPLSQAKHVIRRLEKKLTEATVDKVAAKGEVKRRRAINQQMLPQLSAQYGERVCDPNGRNTEALHAVSFLLLVVVVVGVEVEEAVQVVV